MKALVYEIIAAAAAIDAVGTTLLRPVGLTPMTFNILNVLAEGPLSQREISDRVIVAASSITFQVVSLQARGLVRRRRSDARTWSVSLTPLGEERRREAAALLQEVMGRIRLEPGRAADAARTVGELRSRLAGVAAGSARRAGPAGAAGAALSAPSA